jgi:hypothetical protein
MKNEVAGGHLLVAYVKIPQKSLPNQAQPKLFKPVQAPPGGLK